MRAWLLGARIPHQSDTARHSGRPNWIVSRNRGVILGALRPYDRDGVVAVDV
jgi:hypothetical protein